MKKENDIEKAFNVGDIHSNGKWVWTEWAPGKFDWRAIKKNKNSKTANTSQPAQPTAATPTPANTTTAQPTTTTSAPTAAAKPAPASKKQDAPYDAPKPKVQYKNNPKDLFGVDYKAPESWKVILGGGKIKTQERSVIRKVFKDYDDKKIIDFVNNPDSQNIARHLAWEEAAARGISEDKIKINGSLKNLWKSNAEKQNFLNGGKDDEDDIFGKTYNSAIGDFDIDAFAEQFPEGDLGWMQRNDPRVQSAFNKLQSLRNRQQYDAVVDAMKRRDPNYFNFEDQLASLRISLDDFIETPYNQDTALFISSGGAGAGKTYSLKQLLKEDGLTLFDENKHQSPTDDDIDAVIVEKDMDNDKDFNDTLHKYNGKIIIFDDKDKLLVSGANKIVSMMKNIGDSDPDQRIITDPSGKREKFTGKLIFITNKTFDELNNNEDKKAIMSRARKNDINLTLNENLELLGTRYKTMEDDKFSGKLPPAIEKELRQEVYDFILDNVDKIDPFKFTVRKFTELMKLATATIRSKDKSGINDNFDKLFGGNNSKARNWRASALRELNKAYSDTTIEKSTIEDFENISEESKERYKERYKNNPKKFKELFGEKFIKYLMGESDAVEDDENEVVKSIITDDFNMSIEEAQNILF